MVWGVDYTILYIDESAKPCTTERFNPLATGWLYFKVLFQMGTFCTIRKDNQIVERRLGMTIEVWRLYNCIWHLIALFDKSHTGQLNDESAPLIWCGTSIDGTVFRTSFHIMSIDVTRGQRYVYVGYFFKILLLLTRLHFQSIKKSYFSERKTL